MLEINDVVKCISKYTTMTVGSYGVVKSVSGTKVTVEIASTVGNTGSLSVSMRPADIVKVGRIF